MVPGWCEEKDSENARWTIKEKYGEKKKSWKEWIYYLLAFNLKGKDSK